MTSYQGAIDCDVHPMVKSGFGIVHHFKGGTKDQYENTLKVVHPANGLPKGQTFHAAGPTADGWAVSTAWDNEDSYNDFRDNTLLPGFASADDGLQGPPDQISFPHVLAARSREP